MLEITNSFTIEVDDCIVTYLVATTVPMIPYNVYTAEAYIAFTEFYQDNNNDGDYSSEIVCNYPVTYTFEYSTDNGSSYSSSMPAPFTGYDATYRRFTLQTDNPSLVGNYKIRVTGRLSDSDMKNGNSVT